MATWQCIERCGACCYLAPDERRDLDTCLSPEELALYASLIGDDGWCVHYDAERRACSIYADRPRFCRATPENFERMFAVEPADFDAFAIACCLQHIEDIHGFGSPEWERYERATGRLISGELG